MTTNPQQLTWYQRCANVAGQGLSQAAQGLSRAGSSLASGTWSALSNYGPTAAGKAADLYGKIPSVVKLPLEAYLIYQYAPYMSAWAAWGAVRLTPDGLKTKVKETASQVSHHPLVASSRDKAGQIAGQVLNEVPHYVHAAGDTLNLVRTGDPINALGQRFAIGGGLARDPQEDLTKIDQHLITFGQRQPPDQRGEIPPFPAPPPKPATPALPANHGLDPQAPPVALPATPAVGPRDPEIVNDRMAETNRQLEHLSNHLKRFIPLYAMMALGGIKDDNPQALIEMVREATTQRPDGKMPSAKKVFFEKYGSQLHWAQKFKIWIFNLFGSSFIFSKTVDAYMQTMLNEMRTRLSQARWLEQGENTKRMIDDLIFFLDVYKGATFQYADAKIPTRTLSQYREKALEEMYGKPLIKICKSFSSTLMKNVSPYVKYFEGSWFLPRFGNWVLNRGIRAIVNFYLPKGIHAVILEANDATKPYHLPFVKALTDTSTEQLEKLQAKLDEGPTPPEPPLPGTELLKEAISSLFYMIEFANLQSQKSILEKKEEIEEKKKNPGLNGKIQQGIQDAILKGTHVLLRYFTDPANFEEMFTKFFKLANIPFDRENIVTQADLQMSKDQLNLVVRNIGKRLAREAVEEKIRAARPEQAKHHAEQAFLAHQEDANTTVLRLEVLSQAILQKIGSRSLAETWTEEADILRDLDSMHQVLKAFSIQEQVTNDLEKDLSLADRESILRGLAPLYKNVRHQTNQLLHLQELQLLHKAHFQLAKDLHEIDEILAVIAISNPPERALEQLPHLAAAFDRISRLLPPDCLEVDELRQKIQGITDALEGAKKEKKNLDLLHSLDQQTQAFAESIVQNRSRRTCLNQIRQILNQLPAQDAALLTPLIDGLNGLKFSTQRAAFDVAWNNLKIAANDIQARYVANREACLAHLPPIAPLQEWVRQKESFYRQYQANNAAKMAEGVASLVQEIDAFKRLVENIQRENQLQLTPYHFGLLAGSTLGVLAFFYPKLAATLAAAFYATVHRVAPLLDERKDQVTAGFQIGGEALLGAGAAAALSRIPIIGPSLAAAGTTLVAGAAGRHALDGVIDGGEEKVYQAITEFFGQVYQVAIAGEIYKPAAMIVMQEVVDSYATA